MGRQVSSARIASLVERWRCRLRGVLTTRGKFSSERAFVSELTIACGLNVLSEAQKTRWIGAARVLLVALQCDPEGRQDSEQVRANVDAWIRLYLVDKGPKLLLASEQREAVLAQERDATRRSKRKSANRKTVLISLPSDDVAWLDAFRKRRHLSSRSAAFSALIAQSMSKPAGKSAPPPPGQDLLPGVIVTINREAKPDPTGAVPPVMKKSRSARSWGSGSSGTETAFQSSSRYPP